MLRILLICSGNTCRSPMAEALLNAKVQQNGLSNCIQILSAGLFATPDCPASAGALAAMRQRRLDLAGHQSRQLSPDSVQAADLILTMTDSHKRTLLDMQPNAEGKVYTLAEFAGERTAVSDPFGGDAALYDACAKVIESLLEKAWQKIAALAGKYE